MSRQAYEARAREIISEENLGLNDFQLSVLTHFLSKQYSAADSSGNIPTDVQAATLIDKNPILDNDGIKERLLNPDPSFQALYDLADVQKRYVQNNFYDRHLQLQPKIQQLVKKLGSDVPDDLYQNVIKPFLPEMGLDSVWDTTQGTDLLKILSNFNSPFLSIDRFEQPRIIHTTYSEDEYLNVGYAYFRVAVGSGSVLEIAIRTGVGGSFKDESSLDGSEEWDPEQKQRYQIKGPRILMLYKPDGSATLEKDTSSYGIKVVTGLSGRIIGGAFAGDQRRRSQYIPLVTAENYLNVNPLDLTPQGFEKGTRWLSIRLRQLTLLLVQAAFNRSGSEFRNYSSSDINYIADATYRNATQILDMIDRDNLSAYDALSDA